MSSILVWLPHGSFYNVTLAHPCPNTAAEKMLMQSNSEELSEGHGDPREPGVDVPFIEAAGDSSFGFRFNLGLDISGCCSNSRYINRLSFCPSLSLGCASFGLGIYIVLGINLKLGENNLDKLILCIRPVQWFLWTEKTSYQIQLYSCSLFIGIFPYNLSGRLLNCALHYLIITRSIDGSSLNGIIPSISNNLFPVNCCPWMILSAEFSRSINSWKGMLLGRLAVASV